MKTLGDKTAGAKLRDDGLTSCILQGRSVLDPIFYGKHSFYKESPSRLIRICKLKTPESPPPHGILRRDETPSSLPPTLHHLPRGYGPKLRSTIERTVLGDKGYISAALAKPPTKTVTTQSNHLFASMCAFVKLDMLKQATHTNHFALKSKLFIRALRTAFDALNELQPISLAA